MLLESLCHFLPTIPRAPACCFTPGSYRWAFSTWHCLRALCLGPPRGSVPAAPPLRWIGTGSGWVSAVGGRLRYQQERRWGPGAWWLPSDLQSVTKNRLLEASRRGQGGLCSRDQLLQLRCLPQGSLCRGRTDGAAAPAPPSSSWVTRRGLQLCLLLVLGGFSHPTPPSLLDLQKKKKKQPTPPPPPLALPFLSGAPAGVAMVMRSHSPGPQPTRVITSSLSVNHVL